MVDFTLLGQSADWSAEAIAVSPDQFERKVAAITAYASQVSPMFRTEARLRKQLRRHHRQAGGERIWRAQATPDLRSTAVRAGAGEAEGDHRESARTGSAIVRGPR